MKEYRVRGCIEEVEDGRAFVSNVEKDKASFFGVYEVLMDGTEKWVADFDDQADAEMFAIEKEKEEVDR
jgi:hypothetical protein